MSTVLYRQDMTTDDPRWGWNDLTAGELTGSSGLAVDDPPLTLG